MHIDRYGFGELVVDGHEIRTDVLLTPGGVQEHWWRREGHVLHLGDLGALLDSHPQRLIIGTGAFGQMRPEAPAEAARAGASVVGRRSASAGAAGPAAAGSSSSRRSPEAVRMLAPPPRPACAAGPRR